VSFPVPPNRRRPWRGRGSSVRVGFGFPLFVRSGRMVGRPAGARCSPSQRGPVHRWRIVVSRRRKTPLVLPYEGERRKDPCFALPPGTGPLPRRERQRGSPSQGSQVILWRDTERVLLAGKDARARVSPRYHVIVITGALDGETQGPVFRSTCGTKSSPSQGETERVSLTGGCRSSSGERQRGSSDAESMSVREEEFVKGSRPAIGPSTQGDRGLVSSPS